jgi:hypothetical protein
MIPKRVPAIFFGKIHHTGTQWVQIDVGQAVDQRFSVFNNDALKPIAPEITPPVVAPVDPFVFSKSERRKALVRVNDRPETVFAGTIIPGTGVQKYPAIEVCMLCP